jgi:glycosyltransferase involved in cell wall biosynthesis
MGDGMSGGIQQWVIGLARALSQLDDGSDEYLFLAYPGRDEWVREYVSGPCRVIVAQRTAVPKRDSRKPRRRGLRRRLGARLPVLRNTYRRLMRHEPPRPLSAEHRMIEAEGADVMHFTTQRGFFTSVPTIYQPWDLQHLHMPEFFTPERFRERETAYRAFCAQAAAVVVPTSWAKRDLVRQYRVPPKRVTVVNPPPATWAYTVPTAGEEAAVVERLGLPQRFVLYPAVSWGHKNHERLFEALASLHRRGIDVELVCTGRVTDRYGALMALAERLGIERQVRFLGFVDTTEIQVLYRRATALVFPSLYEGWGLPVVEAFASDLPVAASIATSLPDLVGDAGVQFDPYDPAAIAAAIEVLWLDDAAREAYAGRGRARVAAFSWEHTARLLRALYRRVAGRHLEPSDRDLLAMPPVV